MTDPKQRGFSTRAVHMPKAPEVAEQPASVALYQTSTFRFPSSDAFADVINDRRPGYTYSRGYGNPTVDAFEAAIADLEGTEAAFGFASGMAAIHGVVTDLARAGDRIVTSRELYGGTHSLFTAVVPRYGIEVTWVDPHDLDAVAAALPGARLFYCETIANPVATVADLAALAERCRAAGVPAVVDNTFASPYLCNPAALGFDYVIHSATKYVGGHHDLVGGVVCLPAERRTTLRHTAIDTGGTMAPLEAWLSIRGLATLGLRMERHSRTAQALAEHLEAHPAVERVHYPGLPSHPHHDVARRQLPRGFGGMLAVEVKGGLEAGVRVCDALELAWIAASLGGIHTLVAHAASTTHRQLSPAERAAAGIGEGLIRVSTGLEDADDVIADFDQALAKA
ncbi:MAG TPA: aminotransferase class I/II-fold pyridoxal phosphate-dependent enzyme [Acidimicrobiia bacterium]|nr:aminotransferase class I/II-fold pyridoxal phosphate-dependent enzyme [Acidimicrobiia bacterium]